MANLYTPQTWADNIGGGTPLSAARLNHMETGIEAIDVGLDAHLVNTIAAHAASAISVLDTANNFTSTEVEGVLAELASMTGSGASFGGAELIDASKYATIDDAVAAANAVTGGAVLWLGGGLWTTSNLLTVDSGVGILGVNANLRFNAAGAGLHIPDADSFYIGFTVDGMEGVLGFTGALGTNASGTGADALFKIGTQAGGVSGKAYFERITVRRVGVGGIGCAIHNLQNSNLVDFRVNDSALGSIGLLIDNGCKNVNFFGAWPTNVPTCVKITTSDGTQRTSKINFYTGLCEVFTAAAFRLEDCEQVLIDNVAMNGAGSGAPIGIHLVAGGNRSGTGAKGPSTVQIYGCEFAGPTSSIQMDSPCVIHTGSCSHNGAAQSYKVETTNVTAKIIECRPNFTEGTAKFTSVAGAVEQAVVQRFTTPRSLVFQATPTQWLNMPAALTELNGSIGNRLWAEASRFTHVRLVVSIVTQGLTGSKLSLHYKTSNGTFGTFSSAGTSSVEVPIDAAGTVKSAWIPLAAGAKADVVFAVGGILGDGAVDPTIGTIAAEFY